MVAQITFRIQRNQELTLLTKKFPGSKLILWCNLETDLVEIEAPTAPEANAIAKELVKRFRHVSYVPGKNKHEARTLMMHCPAIKKRSVSLLIERHAGLVMPPVESQNGWDTFRMIALDPTRLEDFFVQLATLGDYEILRKKKLREPFVQEKFVAPTSEILHGLSRKQCEALLLAVAEGYYEIPRRHTLVAIARRQTRPRATLEEHLRKAECKIINSIAPFVGVRMGGLRGPGRPRALAEDSARPRADAWRHRATNPPPTRVIDTAKHGESAARR